MTSTSKRPPLHQIAIVQQLSADIARAVNGTNKETSRQFLPCRELERILTPGRLVKLYEDLFRTLGDEDLSSRLASCETYADETRSEPPRLSLLALFIYDRREASLVAFIEWLGKGGDFPNDENIPFSRGDSALSMLPADDHEYILRIQAVFRPFVVTEYEHGALPADCTKPFIGEPKHIKEGASGAVYKVKIAAGHWKYETRFKTLATNEHDFDVAIKVFGERPNQAAASAKQDYETEREFLRQLRKSNTNNSSILEDWGSIAEDTSFGMVHSMFFELANCDLEEFLTSEAFSAEYTQKSTILRKSTEVLEALAFLHETFHYLHLDIKPDNILVFLRASKPPISGNPNAKPVTRMNWKITDFNLSRKQIKKRSGKHFEISSTASYESAVVSPRKAGAFQAPEIEEHNESLASGRSDVWSMGCVLLMTLAFLCDGSDGVQYLREHISVTFQDQGGRRDLFYLTKSNVAKDCTHSWPGPEPPPIGYLNNFRPRIETIREGLEATVHTRVLEWSAYMYENAKEPEKECLKQAFKLLFTRVLVVDREQRVKAPGLKAKFAKIANRYQKLKDPNEIEEPPEEDYDDTGIERVEILNLEDDSTHSKLCIAISDKDAPSVTQLLKDHQDPNRPCPLCKKYPICQILRCQADLARNRVLEALLELDAPEAIMTRIHISEKGFTNPLEIAWQEPGDADALEILFAHRAAEISVDEEFKKMYRDSKKSLSNNSTKAIDKHMKASKSSKFSSKPKAWSGSTLAETRSAVSGTND